jgi:hypothetical protein
MEELHKKCTIAHFYGVPFFTPAKAGGLTPITAFNQTVLPVAGNYIPVLRFCIEFPLLLCDGQDWKFLNQL